MRTIIYGAGGVGGTVAGFLARTGHEVLLIDRSGIEEKIVREDCPLDFFMC
jgi:Trk K+ transport system NAD-binding subunit